MADQKKQAQEALLKYFKRLEPQEAKNQLSKIIKMTHYGAKVQGKELAKVFDLLGYDGKTEVARMDYDFVDQLADIYRDLEKDSNKS